MRKILFTLLAVASLMLLAYASWAKFYAYYEGISIIVESKGFSEPAANAVKHAYAAAQVYDKIAEISGPANAEGIVLFLGAMNEYMERVTKSHNPDSGQEILKDYHNNLAGITVTRWQAEHDNKKDLLVVLARMAKAGVLVVNNTKNPFPLDDETGVDKNVVNAGNDWLLSNREQIKERVAARLDRFYTTRTAQR